MPQRPRPDPAPDPTVGLFKLSLHLADDPDFFAPLARAREPFNQSAAARAAALGLTLDGLG